ncbi:MAG TPA: choice-of-anchor Q domain-containing protein, partial [Kofleriaceae bacterium]
VVLEDLTIRNGLAPRGGGLLVHGGATLRRVRVENNVAESALDAEGGGIYCDHVELVLEDTTVIGNRASLTDTTTTEVRVLGGGGVYHQGDRLRIIGGSIEENRVTGGASGNGGGLVMDQSHHEWDALTDLTVDGTSIRGNTIELTGSDTRGTGGGIYFRGVEGPSSRKMTLANVRLEGNRIVANGGMGGGLLCSVQNGFGGSPTIEIVGTTVAMNRLELGTGYGTGGGIAVFEEYMDGDYELQVTVDRSRVTGNAIVGGNSISGGGLWLDHGPTFDTSRVESTLSITRSEIADNELQGSMSNGAGIYYQCHICDSHLVLAQSTVSGNRSIGSQGAKSGGVGTGDIINVSVIDSTISNNEARAASGPARGGGIGVHSHEISSLHVASSTITANLVTGPDAAGGGIYFDAWSDESNEFEDRLTATVANTIVAQNTGGDCAAEFEWVFYEARSTGYNLFGAMGTCNVIAGTGDQLGANAQLLPLADNGGATKTHALGASSPALDRGDPVGCKAFDGTVLAVDQRDLPRVANGRCDVGSVEAQ